MKIISWDDAYPKRERDAHDLLFILENYNATGIEDKLHETLDPLLIEEDFDSRLAPIRVLGRDIARLGSPETIKRVEEILTRETNEDQGVRMLADMAKGRMIRGTKFETALQLLEKLLQGIQENKPKS